VTFKTINLFTAVFGQNTINLCTRLALKTKHARCTDLSVFWGQFKLAPALGAFLLLSLVTCLKNGFACTANANHFADCRSRSIRHLQLQLAFAAMNAFASVLFGRLQDRVAAGAAKAN
jgi:hypothetical protein